MTVRYITDHIPTDTAHNRRPGLRMHATTVTIHNTANPSSTARNERGWLVNPSNTRTASFHIVVDDSEAIECIPLNEVAWHAGDGNGDGNRASIGVEICESGDYEKTLDNAATVVAKILRVRGWGIDRLRRHYDWSGKICPRKMYDGGTWQGWDDFKAKVARELGSEKHRPEKTTGLFNDVPENHWARTSIEKAASAGVMAGVSEREFAPNEPVTRAQMAVILDRIGILNNE